jgi:hypothetical protein
LHILNQKHHQEGDDGCSRIDCNFHVSLK